ncbi:MAG TPA: chloride channel protein [Planctomycetaceae bacterium]|nr:chloride channel protein [Planctomycetaceae bacterium]
MERLPYNQLDRPGKIRLAFDVRSTGRLLLCSLLVGILAGLVAAGFYSALGVIQRNVSDLYKFAGIHFTPAPHRNAVHHDVYEEGPEEREPIDLPLTITDGRLGASMRTDKILDYFIVPKYWLLIILIPGFGGLLCGIIICSFAREAGNEGTDHIIKAFHLRNGIIRFRLLLVKTLSSLVTLGTGGSAGWESPAALVGAGTGSLFCRFLKTNAEERRMLLLAGTAGGIGAIFQVPLGGAFFAVEILYCTFAVELRAFLPCLVASVSGYATFQRIVGPSIPIDRTQCVPFEWGFPLLVHLPLFVLFAFLCAALGWFYVRCLHETRNRIFRRLSLPEFMKPALGGMMLGVVAIFFPMVFGGGYEWISSAIEGNLSAKLMCALVLAKILATSLTIGSGGSGGLLGPSLFIGAMLGGGFGTLLHQLFALIGLAWIIPQPAVFVILGMGAFYGGIGKVPLAAAVLTCEIVGGSYFLTIPLLLIAMLHFGIQSPRTSLYEEQVLTPLDSAAHFGDFVVELLQVIRVDQVVKLNPVDPPKETVLIPQTASIAEVMRTISASTDTHFPVVDDDRTLVGLVSLGDVRSAFVSLGDWRLLIADDLAQLPEMYVLPDDSLYTVLRICNRGGITEIPVVDSAETRRVIGMIRRHEIIAAYNDSISRFRDN